jgi:flagellar biosynthesis anti-sigma factor FlgM
MKVNPQGLPEPRPPASSEASAASRGRARASSGPPPASATSAGVDLSSTAQAFLRFRARLDGVPAPERADRIARLRDEIAGGRYDVGGERIAGAMLRDDAAARMLGLRRD